MPPVLSPSRTRVLHVFGSLKRGGAEMRTLEVLRSLNRDRFAFGMVALSGERGELASVAEADGMAVEACALGRGFGRRFMRLLERLEIHVVHSHVHYASGYLLFLAKRAGVGQRIAHFRNTSDGQGSSLRRRLQRAVMRRLIDAHATDILAVSEGTMREAWRVDWAADPRCRVIFNGLDTSPFRVTVNPADVRREFGWNANAPILLNVASFQPAKNQMRVVEIFDAVGQQNPDARMLFVGREVSGYQAQVRDAVNRLGIADRVAFAGERSDVPRLIKAADVLLFPSLWEGLPGAVLESCAAGLPVVASDIPGVLEIGRYFPSVHSVSLSQSNATWAELALAVVSNPRPDRDGSVAFEHTPFALPRAATSLGAVYERHRHLNNSSAA